MWTIIILTALVFLFVISQAIIEKDADCIMPAFGIAIYMFFISLFIALALPAKTEFIEKTYSLELMSDGSKSESSYFIASGGSSEKMVYVFYYGENGTYRMKQVDADNLVIRYTDGQPKIVKTEEHMIKGEFINLFAIDFMSDDTYVAYIPKGSIKNDYKLDAE